VAYHRDRGDNLVQKNLRNKNSYFESDIEEWGYLFTLEGEWLVKGYGGEIQKLASLLSGYE
jgi:hypothetical protein